MKGPLAAIGADEDVQDGTGEEPAREVYELAHRVLTASIHIVSNIKSAMQTYSANCFAEVSPIFSWCISLSPLGRGV